MMGELLNHLVDNDAFTQPPDEPLPGSERQRRHQGARQLPLLTWRSTAAEPSHQLVRREHGTAVRAEFALTAEKPAWISRREK